MTKEGSLIFVIHKIVSTIESCEKRFYDKIFTSVWAREKYRSALLIWGIRYFG